MRATIFFLAGIFLAGCASTQPSEPLERLPQLIVQEPFPPMSETLFHSRHDVDLKIQVAENGNVLRAELLNPTGDAEWDSLAVLRIGTWRFAPAMHEGKTMQMWVTIHAQIRFDDPITMHLAEIVCPSSTVADSVYDLLLAGEDFSKLASIYSIGPSGAQHGDLGEVDIHRYLHVVQKDLISLKENRFTRPLAMGDHFYIFKRVGRNVQYQ